MGDILAKAGELGAKRALLGYRHSAA